MTIGLYLEPKTNSSKCFYFGKEFRSKHGQTYEEFENQFVEAHMGDKGSAIVILAYTEDGETIHHFEGSLEGEIVKPSGPVSLGWE